MHNDNDNGDDNNKHYVFYSNSNAFHSTCDTFQYNSNALHSTRDDNDTRHDAFQYTRSQQQPPIIDPLSSHQYRSLGWP
jgi:hypothetical protein